MLGIKKNNEARRLVKDVFQNVNDIVVPTMGAKGLLVAIDDDFGKCTLTDDGVTVARQAIHMDGMERMIAVDMIEAASNTEKEALDGTTLTVLLTNEIYKYGYNKIRFGMHPQNVSEEIEKEINIIRERLKGEVTGLTDKGVKQIATISTKIPRIGEIVYEAYKKSGKEMNITIEHDREGNGIKVEHSEGFSIDSGYMSDAMRNLCSDGETWAGDNCWVVLLKEGIMTQAGMGDFFKSIPGENINDGFVFVMNPNFNPNTLRLLIDTLIKNNMKYQFIFVNEAKMDDVYMDIAAVTGGSVQDASAGIGDYLFKYCGHVSHIEIGIDKTLMIGEGDTKERIKVYKNRLGKKYKLSGVDEALYTRRLSALENGIVKIMVGVPTITEYQTLKLKLDDAIGAVKKAFEKGVVLGGGKALWNISEGSKLKKVLRKPLKRICKNAGVSRIPSNKLKDKRLGINAITKKVCNLKEEGILDSYMSIDEALKNSSSIACSYLKTNCIIKKEITQKK